MSQTYYSDNYAQQYYPPTSYNTTQPPIQHTQSHTSAYNYQNNYYNAGVTPSAHTVNNSSTLAQQHTYSNTNYATDTTTNAASSYGSPPSQMVSHHPDSVNQIPQQGVPQYGDFAPGQSWAGPHYAEVPAVRPDDLHDQRRGSCASMSTDGSGWYSHNASSDGHYNRNQSMFAEQNCQYDQDFQHTQHVESNFGMYSPGSYARTQELARNTPHEPAILDAPYGTLPMHEPKFPFEHPLPEGYQMFSNGPITYCHASPSTQSHSTSTQSPPPSALLKEESDLTESEEYDRDLFVQQRQAASYQQELQAQQELKYQLSGQFEQFEANHRRHDGFATDQDHHHQNHLAHHRHTSSSVSSSSSEHHSHRLVSAPIVPSQAHERAPTFASASPEAEDKKDTPAKKPALACLFCRKRKIACGPPPPDSTDRTCNQCLRRKQVCEYPTESRRGIRKAPKEPAPEEQTVHKFVHGDPGSHDATGAIRRGRRKRTAD
ncbi:unnamed protein product [Rhizoctonia solani]|uniref:Zn(2)-C6 fungal-type domain-containing protein n=1 Tax=Rhizoctonia solani TaxID=456999 RepID=A0A8H2X429_9AGAM|nr:unnamed protein product [Rhizoctonia solani]